MLLYYLSELEYIKTNLRFVFLIPFEWDGNTCKYRFYIWDCDGNPITDSNNTLEYLIFCYQNLKLGSSKQFINYLQMQEEIVIMQ